MDKGPETPARPLRVLGVEPADWELSALETIIPAGKSVYVLRADPRRSGKSPAYDGWLGRPESGKIDLYTFQSVFYNSKPSYLCSILQ